ncbi:tissue factor-like [Acipenser ruthenus]|uniref:tissue factor-like n=1 Tax=Acipenser ruthenus TaxID=7906 RepID=UPI00274195DA|nr:tissue factor-like [Acipenser ruthenus]
MGVATLLNIGCFVLCFLFTQNGKASGISQLPVATKVWWTSINFKTILEWEPKPSGYAYTVEFFGKKTDVQKSPRCIKIQTTECDLTSFLLNLTDSYTAHVISEPIETVDKTEEYPYTRSDKFTPYKDTKIGQPTFKFEENEAKDNIKLLIEAPLSSIRGPNNTFLSIQEIFKNDLEYVTYYRKASSTGKKEAKSTINEINVPVDRGESYCFNVHIVIPSRSDENQQSQDSATHCSHSEKPFYEEYGIGVLVGLILVPVLLLVAIITCACCCLRKKNANKDANSLDGVPLKGV